MLSNFKFNIKIMYLIGRIPTKIEKLLTNISIFHGIVHGSIENYVVFCSTLSVRFNFEE